MKAIVWFIAGLAGATIFTVAVGLLSVQISGALSGAVYDINNIVVAVANPSVPVLQYVAVAALSALMVYSVTLGTRPLPVSSRIAWVAGLSVGLLALTGWALALRAALISSSGREQGMGLLHG